MPSCNNRRHLMKQISKIFINLPKKKKLTILRRIRILYVFIIYIIYTLYIYKYYHVQDLDYIIALVFETYTE